MTTIKNLIATEADERLLWNQELACLEAGEGDSKQSLLLTSRLQFSVKNINLSPFKNLIALSGDKGLAIVELPTKWGSRYKQDSDDQIYCTTYNINQRLYSCQKRLQVLHVAWHPYCSETKQVICVLTNDNKLRFHDVIEDLELQVINIKLPNANETDTSDEDEVCLGLSMLNLGESAICFDFAPPLLIQEPDILWPIYILMGTGDVLLIYSNLRNPTYAEHIIGPLTMLPQAEDNYGADACSLLVIHSSPPMIAIATPTGQIYHCFAFLDDESLLPSQTLHVYESIELSKDLVENMDYAYNTQPLRLIRDPTSEIRYFCVHQNGIHTIVLPILESLQSEYDFTQDKESFSEFLLCTRTSTPANVDDSVEDLSTPRGLGVEIGKEATMHLLVLMPNNELVIQRISPATASIIRKRVPRNRLDTSRDTSGDQEILNLSQVDAARSNFVEQMEQILKRKSSVPTLKLSENLENPEMIEKLMQSTTKIFENEYLKKYKLANEAVKKKLGFLKNDMGYQKKELLNIQKRKDEIYNEIIVLDSQVSLASETQKNIVERIQSLVSSLSSKNPELSEQERNLSRDLVNLNEKLRMYRDQLDSIIAKHNYHIDQKDPALNPGRKNMILSQSQIDGIKDTLSKQGADIASLKKFVKSRDIKT